MEDEELSRKAPEGSEQEEKETSELEENIIKTMREGDISKKSEEGGYITEERER